MLFGNSPFIIKTFRFKLTLWYSCVLAVVLLAFSYIAYLGLSRTIEEQIDSSLWLIAETEAASLVDAATGAVHIHEVNAHMVSSEGLLDKYIQLLDDKGVVISKSSNLGQDQLPGSQELIDHSLQGEIGFETVSSAQEEDLRLISLPIIDEGKVNYILQMGAPLQSAQEILYNFMLQLLPLGLGSLLLASVGGWFLARQALKPVGEITKTAQVISSQNLHKRLDFKVTPDEIGQLIEVLNDMLERLEQAFVSQRRFIADASHELRSPLTAIKGTLEVLLRRKRSVQEYEQGVGSALEEIDRLSRLVNNLLILAHTDTSDEELRFQEVRLDRLLADVFAQIEILAQQKDIQFQADIEEQINCNVDADKLRQLIINLLHNAIRYTPRGGWVKLSLQRENDDIKITVSDNGIGISQDDLSHIFERFYRVEHSRRSGEPGGSGLGLAICQWIVKAHKGRVEVDSTPGEGSTFTVYLPG